MFELVLTKIHTLIVGSGSPPRRPELESELILEHFVCGRF